MVRKRSNHLCEKCGKPGFKRTNPIAVEHYDSESGKIKRCYVKKLIQHRKKEQKVNGKQSAKSKSIEYVSGFEDKETISAKLPPEYFWGQSELYHKIGHLSNRFLKIAKDLNKIKKRVYYFKPPRDISIKSTKNLDLFEMQFLVPIEKILAPYYDMRYSCDWSTMLKIQADVSKYGLSGSASTNAIPTGRIFKKTDVNTGKSELIEGAWKFAPSYLKRNRKRILKLAKMMLDSFVLQQAFYRWYTETKLIEEVAQS